MVHRGSRATALVGLLVVLAACSPAGGTGTAAPSPSPSAPATAAPPDGLTASLVQYRRDQPRRFVEVKFTNATTAALDVTMLDVSLPGYGPSSDVRRTTHLEADRRVDLPVALGDPQCQAPPDGIASVVVTVDADGSDPAVRTRLPIDDGGLLDRLHTFECAVQRADKAVDLVLDPGWERRGSGDDLVVSGSATATLRDPAATVEIAEVTGGILFIAPPEAVTPAPPIVVDADRDHATVGFELIPARCDGHAIAEARRLTTVTFSVAVDGAEPVPVRVAPDEAGFETLVTALRDRCGTG